jgi:hypothetical protein
LAGLEAFHHSTVWGVLQSPGFLLGMSIWGLDNGEDGFEVVMVIANGLVYGILLISAWLAGRAPKPAGDKGDGRMRFATLHWPLRFGLIAICLALASGRILEHGRASGVTLFLVSRTCSAELLGPLDRAPLRLRLEAGGEVRIGDVIMPPHQLRKVLQEIGSTSAKNGLVWVDGDDSLKADGMSAFLSDVQSALPAWKLLLITHQTRSACEAMIKSKAGPAA